MVVEFMAGNTQEYEAQIDFGLNFDDRNLKSVKVKKGRRVAYDGEVASYINDTGDHFSGRCSSLKSAINALQWLIPCEDGGLEELLTNKVSEDRSSKADYDNLKGGSFSTAVEKTGEFAFMGKKREILHDDDLVVKRIPALRTATERPTQKRLEISLDQNSVKTIKKESVVNSSTIRSPKKVLNLSTEVSEDYSVPLKKNSSNKKAYLVDATTPRTINDDMTLSEVHKVMNVVVAEDSQDAVVVKKIEIKKDTKEVDGVILRRPKPQKTEMTLNKIKAPTEMTIVTTVGKPGSDSAEVFDQASEVIVPPDKVVKKKAEERAKARKAASAETQKKVEEMYGVVPGEVVKKKIVKKVAQKKIVKKKTVRKRTVKKKVPISKTASSSNYLLMLPENWGELHWTKKEKFIKELTDINFIKYLLTVGKTKAVQNACRSRLNELGEKKSG